MDVGGLPMQARALLRDPRIIGNWYDTGVVLAALVARGADCWTPDCLIARTTVRLVIDNTYWLCIHKRHSGVIATCRAWPGVPQRPDLSLQPAGFPGRTL